MRSFVGWPESFLHILNKDPLLSAIVIGIIVYAISIFWLIISGQWRLVAAPALFVGIIGIGWALFFYWVGSHGYRDHLDLVTNALRQDQCDIYKSLKAVHLQGMSNNRKHVGISIVIFVGCSVVIALEMFGWMRVRFLGVFPPEWSSASQYLPFFRLASIYCIGIVGVPLGWTLGRLIIKHTLFLGRISYLEYRPSQHIYFLCMRPLFRINLLAAFGWSLGIALVAFLFRDTYTTMRIGFLVILGIVPTVAFFWPTWLFQEKLRVIGTDRAATLVTTAIEKLDLATTNPKDPDNWAALFTAEEQITKQTTDIPFAIAWRYGAYLITSFVAPVVTAVLGAILITYFGKP